MNGTWEFIICLSLMFSICSLIIAFDKWLKRELKLQDNIIRLTSDEFEITEVLINGQFIPPGNISEIVMPHLGMGCFAMQGTFNGKWTILYAAGAVKIVAIPKSEFPTEKKEDTPL
jgi:hypothetical protein